MKKELLTDEEICQQSQQLEEAGLSGPEIDTFLRSMKEKYWNDDSPFCRLPLREQEEYLLTMQRKIELLERDILAISKAIDRKRVRNAS